MGRSVHLLFMLVALAVLVVLFLSALPLRLTLWIRRYHGDEEGAIELVYLFGLVHWRRRLFSITGTSSDEGPAISINHETSAVNSSHRSPTMQGERGSEAEHAEVTTEDVWRLLTHWQALKSIFDEAKPVLRKLGHRALFRRLQVKLTVGTSDVVTTGIAYGTTWAVTMGIIGSITYWARFSQKPTVHVNADFQKATVEGSAECIVEIRLGYAILAGLRLLRVWRSVKAAKEEM